jgi:hypothetical protein
MKNKLRINQGLQQMLNNNIKLLNDSACAIMDKAQPLVQ